MHKLSKTGAMRLDTCHKVWQLVVIEMLKRRDMVVVCGHRDEIEQNKAFASGASTKKWKESRHNSFPSLAIDLAEFNKILKNIDWDDIENFKEMNLEIMEIAAPIADDYGFRIRWGGDWKNLKDYVHYELVKKDKLFGQCKI